MSKNSTGEQEPESKQFEPQQGIDYNELVKAIMENMPKQQTIDVEKLTAAIKGDNKDSKHQSHGISQGEMKSIKEQQQLGKVEMMKANKNSRYEIPVYEKKFIHFSTEKVAFDQNSGKRTSKPVYHVKTVEDFIKMSKTVKNEGDIINPENAFAGLRVIILHDPRIGTPEEAKTSKERDQKNVLESMTEDALRSVYFELYGEEALPSDSKKILIELIKEKQS